MRLSCLYLIFFLLLFSSCTQGESEKQDEIKDTSKSVNGANPGAAQQPDTLVLDTNSKTLKATEITKATVSDPKTTVNKSNSLPPIYPPAEDTAKYLRLKVRLSRVGKKNGSSDVGGKGPDGCIIPSKTNAKQGNTDLYTYNFTNYKVTSSLRKLNADGAGTIACRVSVDCDGKWFVNEYGSRGTTYNGSVEGLRNVVTTFLHSASFEKIGNTCPESGIIYIEVKNSY